MRPEAETSPRIARLLAELPRRGTAAVDELWRELATDAGTPVVEAVDGESALVTFLWRGAAEKASVGWGVDVPLRRVEGTDLWYGSRRLPLSLRTLYFITHAEWRVPPTSDPADRSSHVDPLNPHPPFRFPPDPYDPTDHESFGSYLELAEAPAEPWCTPQPGVARGTHRQASVRSRAWGGRRQVGVYRPAAAHLRPGEPTALLVVFDDYLSRTVLRVPTTLDNLIAAGRIPPTTALFIHSANGARRFRDLRPGAALRHVVTREILLWARRRWPITADPGKRVVAGSSLGGLAAAYVGLAAPWAFGGVLAQSGSFWWPAGSPSVQPQWLTREYARRPRLPLRLYLDVGDQEVSAPEPGIPDQVTANRAFRDVLRERGYPVRYAEYAGGHDYVNWRRTFADGLVHLLDGGVQVRGVDPVGPCSSER
jgi:enterochelin esterase family protein